MASIFTYNEEPVRVSSPWLQDREDQSEEHVESNAPASAPRKITRLQAEPQEGPVEYKLHLLLRPRRQFTTSTGNHLSGSKHSKYGSSSAPARAASESFLQSPPASGVSTPSSASTQQTRQHRLEQLTTQLLWRLQQSSPHHTSSATNIILPSLPEALPELQAPQHIAKLLHGLEESQGALYEIGISDDGSMVGLAEDELNESINNLRAMAACLGCSVEVLRKEVVGECEWQEEVVLDDRRGTIKCSGNLFVAEAIVKPYLQPSSPILVGKDQSEHGAPPSSLPTSSDFSPTATDQLRITLTGPTMSGKSTLLGTLTTSTLDNGRGTSRLSMLKHRHEINSGLTSSVTQELIGYQDIAGGDVEVVNYATENVASWIDIHVAAAGNRLILISDSAGHPRYRRTTVRGLVGWAPHWTLLCISADDTEVSTSKTYNAQSAKQVPIPSDMDLSGAQLDLCLRLKLPLIVVITKLDLASKTGLRDSLTKVLNALKAAGKTPIIMRNSAGVPPKGDLQIVQAGAIELAYNTALPLLNDATATVPIVLTSAVDGTGIENLHALLHELPIAQSVPEEESFMIYDVEDVYTKPAEVAGVIISGRVRRGQVSVGDTLVIGPFSYHDSLEDSEDSDERPKRRSSHLPTSRSFPGALRGSHFTAPMYQLPDQEWRRVKVTSIRNLRLPVHTLGADQVGTIAISLEQSGTDKGSSLLRIRKGMVLAAIQSHSTRSFTAKFKRDDLETLAVGSHVLVYTCSVRASARVVSARAPDSPDASDADRQLSGDGEDNDPFSFDDIKDSFGELENAKVAGAITASNLLVSFSFDAGREFVLVDQNVLVMPGGGGAFGGLEGIVGHVTEVRG